MACAATSAILRATLLGVALLLCPLTAIQAAAQVAGRNVNMVTGGTFPGGDPFLQKQNEPMVAVSSRNPCHLLAGANDYRAVNLPGLPEDREIGDAWLGWYTSDDCGATWYSTLMPGYPQDNSPEGNAAPVKGLTTGADPYVLSGSGGTFYYLFIAFNRGSNVGKLALARAIDHNDQETFVDPDALPDVDARRAVSSIQYGGMLEVARGSAGKFIDKPSLAVFPASSGTCTIDGETVPANNVYVAWTEFVSNSDQNIRTKVYFARSADCGATLAGPATKLSEGYPVNQGTVIAVNPVNPNEIMVLWRQIRSDKTQDGILFARSTDGGRSFTKAEFVPGLGEGQYFPFDQNTTSTLSGNTTTTFRTVGFPAAVYTDEGPNGTMYVALAQPLTPNPGLGGLNSRIFLLRYNGAWSSAVQAVPSADPGHQFMPALTYVAGRLHLIWYDARFDESGLTSTRLIDEVQALAQKPAIRHTMDVMGAQAVLPLASWPPPPAFFQLYGAAQPDFNDSDASDQPLLRGPKVSQYAVGDADPTNAGSTFPNGTTQPTGARAYQFNMNNLTLHGGGRIPFMGDYISVAGRMFTPNGNGQWVYNGLANKADTSNATVHAAWTDNRDVKIPEQAGPVVLPYSPPATLPSGVTLNDVTACTPDTTRTRNSNVYTSRITQDFSLTIPDNAKPTNTEGVVRAFAVHLANGLDAPQTFTLSLTDPAASFSKDTFATSYPTCSPASGAPLSDITINVLPKSSATRTVYVNCGTGPAKRVVVTATRLSDGAVASAIVNPDPSNPPKKKSNGTPLGPEAHNPDAENPDAENPDAENPDAENPDAENPDAENPDAENPDAENPDAENPDAENPDAENPDAENANFQDVSVEITNSGDTTSGYQVGAQISSPGGAYSFLLIANRVTSHPTSIKCHLVREHVNQQIFAILNPDLTSGGFTDPNDPDAQNTTILVRPGESIRLTLRAVWNSVTTPQPFCSTDPNSPDYCFSKVIFRARAQAPNTGETEPREVVFGAFPDLEIDSDTITVSPQVVGLGGFTDSPGATIVNSGLAEAVEFSWGTFLTDGEESTPTTTIGGIGSLAPGATTASGPFRVTVPVYYAEGETAFPPGPYDIVFMADDFEDVFELSESNNTAKTATPITVVPYRATIGVNDVEVGVTTPVTVTVRDADFNPVPGATVTLSLEGPNALAGKPGPDGTFSNTVGPAVTDVNGNALFNIRIDTEASDYRYVLTVELPGVGTMKFQSVHFSAYVYAFEEEF